MMNVRTVSTPPLTNNEWLARIIARFPFGPISLAVIWVALCAVRDITLALCFDAWSPQITATSVRDGLSSQPPAWFFNWIAPAVMLGYYSWIQSAGRTLFKELIEEGIFTSETHLKTELTKTHRRFRSRIAPYMATLVGLAYSLWYIWTYAIFPDKAPYPTWVTAHPAIVLVNVPLIFVALYALAMVLYDLAAVFIALGRLVKQQTFRVEPLNPDGAGGLGAIGRFSANLSYGIGVFGLSLFLGAIFGGSYTAKNYPLFALIALYVLGVLLVFFLPLWSTHTEMTKFRSRLVKEISNEFDDVFRQLRNSRAESADVIQPLLEKAQQIDEMLGYVKRFPIWPFNLSSVRKFFGVAWSPLIPTIISIAVELWIK